MAQRGATEQEILDTVAHGTRVPARRGRVAFRYAFRSRGSWRDRRYRSKQIIAYAAPTEDGWMVITVIVKYRRREETLQ